MFIHSDRRITDIQNEFNTIFPGLKIVFYAKKHTAHEGSAQKNEYDPALTLGEIQTKKRTAEIELDDQLTISQFEQIMENEFGLHVQVFRRSKNLWLQTTATDDWTLEVQNRKGIHSTQNR
ncbi:MAG TPA: hypothetical protein PKA00_02550 [Saprospiraceae bacterium]|nr:hypothetical protein [Saprospiraceae bacterium]HMQ81753.1 hypothetical protein [Saprospiraceae bacterium]